MNDEVYSFALKNTLDEIQNICPEMKNSLVFKEDGSIIARDENTSEDLAAQIIESFNTISDKTDAIGSIEGITLDCSKGELQVLFINELYMVTVTTEKADKNYVDTVTRVLVPTILRLLEKIRPAPLKRRSLPKTKTPIPEDDVLEEDELEEDTEEESEEDTKDPRAKEDFDDEEADNEDIIPEPPVHQLIVENLGGLLVPSDTVRMDTETLSQWERLFEDVKIEEVNVETFNGKSTRCKVKPMKDSKYEGKGIIRMPEKIQNILQIRKSELVRVKPVID